MSDTRAEDLEKRIAEACQRGDVDGAVTLALEAYGHEVFGFLVDRMRSEPDASEVFSDFCLELWRSLHGFERRCSARTWCYTIARHAASHYRRGVHRQPDKRVPLSAVEQLSALEARVRSETAEYLKTRMKSRMVELRRKLPADDQTLLILRLDKSLTWKELALVMTYEGESPSDTELEKEAARLRKRFQLAKGSLKHLAKDAGLLD